MKNDAKSKQNDIKWEQELDFSTENPIMANNSKLATVNEDEELESVVLLKGRELSDSRRLMDENVTHNTTLHFYVKKDAQNVTVKMHDRADAELNLKADETAESLRGKISALSSLGARDLEITEDKNQLDLFYRAKALKDGPLSNYGVFELSVRLWNSDHTFPSQSRRLMNILKCAQQQQEQQRRAAFI